MGMFHSVSNVIHQKVADGSLDLASLDQQAQSMLGKISREHPELQGLLANPDLTALMTRMA